MAKLKFNNTEERRAYMARRYIKAGKPIPKKYRTQTNPHIVNNESKYKHGIFARIKHFVGNIFLRYPKVVAATAIALSAYIFFQRANGITQWAGGLALSTLAIANPQASVNLAKKTHEFMSYNVEKAGEKMSK